ncbi:MAG: recombinase family protein [Phycisphaerales bacterium]|nr:recombinase family protein [Phycisphaerales bacterium]
MQNCVIWARVSSREQREGYSIDAQLRVTREKANREGWAIAREFVVAESAKRGAERTVFNEMLKWVKANARKLKLNYILAHKLDRTCRNMRDAVRLQELEDTCGIKLSFVENQFGPGAAGALSFNVMAAVAQYYSDNLRTEVLKGIEEKVRQGWAPGSAPYGYLNVSNKEEPIQPHDVNATAVQRIFELYATGTYTFRDIADKMECEGYVYQPSYPRFHRTALSYILNNRFYIGMVTFRGQSYPGKHKPIIDMKTFEECRDLLHGKNRRGGGRNTNHYLAGGMFTCEHCGFGITSERIRRKMKSGKVHEYIYYRCGNLEPTADHPVVRWRQDQLEEAITTELATLRIPDDERRNWLRQSLALACDNNVRLQEEINRTLRKRQTEITQIQQRLLDGYLVGSIDKSTFTAKSTELKLETDQLRDRLAEAAPPSEEFRKRVLETFDFAQNVGARWKVSDTDLRRQILTCILLKRSLSDVSLVTTKRKPFDVFTEGPFLDASRGDRI